MEAEIEKLRLALADAARTRPMTAAYLYGSRARGTDVAGSDWDVAIFLVEAPTENRTVLELGLVERLELHSGVGPLDVRIMNGAPLLVRGRVLTEGVLLYSGEDADRVRLERETRIRYLDYLPRAERLDRALLAGFAREGSGRG